MASRYSPGVLPEPNLSFADTLGGLEGGYETGFGIRGQLRKQKQDEEDRRLALQRDALADALQRQAARHAGVVQDTPTIQHPKKTPPLSTAVQPSPIGAPPPRLSLGGGYSYDPTLAAQGRKEDISSYLERQLPVAAARAEPTMAREQRAAKAQEQKERDLANDAQVAREQYGQDHPDLMDPRLSNSEVVKRAAQYRAAAMPARPAAARPTTPTQRTTAQTARVRALQARVNAAQARLHQLEAMPEFAAHEQTSNAPAGQKPTWPHGVTQDSYSRWVPQYDSAAAILQRAQNDLQDAMTGLGPSGPGGAAPRRSRTPTSRAGWVAQVAADPMWADSTPQQIRNEAKRRADAAGFSGR